MTEPGLAMEVDPESHIPAKETSKTDPDKPQKKLQDSGKKPTIINGYTVLSVASRLAPKGSKESTRSTNFLLWFKKYEPGKTEQTTRDMAYRPVGKTIFVKGIPAFMNQKDVIRIFRFYHSERLSINLVTFLPNNMNEVSPTDNPDLSVKAPLYPRMGYMQAYITYENPEDVSKIVTLPKDSRGYYIENPDKPSLKTELRKVWAYSIEREYQYNHQVLMDHYMTFMKQFDEQQKKLETENKQISEEADEDGWVTVVRTKSHRPPKAVKSHEIRVKKKKKQSIVHFYKHQVTDSKLDRIKDLRNKFEEDKKKIAEMKQKRKFKPQ